MDFKNAVKALQIGKKEGKKFRLSTEFGKNPEEELPFPEYPRPQMRPGKLDKSERMVGVCVHGNAENAKTAGRKNSRSVFPGVRCVRREAAAASKRISVVLPHDSASQKFLPENGCCCSSAPWIRMR